MSIPARELFVSATSRAFTGLVVAGCFLGCGGSGSKIEGRIVDGKGNAMSGIVIRANQIDPIKGYEFAESSTMLDGSFTLGGLYPDSEYVLRAGAEGWSSPIELRVRSAPSGESRVLTIEVRYFLKPPEIILDSKTDLEWIIGQDAEYDWEQSRDWAEALEVGGGGWRLPTSAELATLHEPQGSPPTHRNVAFKKSESAFIWSSELTDETGVVVFNFKYGKTFKTLRRYKRSGYFRGANTRSSFCAFAVRNAPQE